MVAPRETAELAKRLIAETCAKQGIVPGTLTIHADRGTSMTSKPLALLMADLRVTKTHSRPHVSDDNPYSESQFKTLKYRPEFPERFGSIEDSRAFAQTFFTWYKQQHHHSGIANAPFEDEPISEEENRAVAASKAWLAEHPGEGIPHEELLAEFGIKPEDLHR
jgi:transposase InsO family protein